MTFRYVSCCPANEAAGRSSAVALERTATALGPSSASACATPAAYVLRDDDLLDAPAQLGAERADRLVFVRRQAREPFELIIVRGHLQHDPAEGAGRHAKAGRHVDAGDPRQLRQLRALATDERELA